MNVCEIRLISPRDIVLAPILQEAVNSINPPSRVAGIVLGIGCCLVPDSKMQLGGDEPGVWWDS